MGKQGIGQCKTLKSISKVGPHPGGMHKTMNDHGAGIDCQRVRRPLGACVTLHSLAWLMVANLVGLLLAALLLYPRLDRWMAELSYGRWVSVHMNLQLYGWCSLPLVAWLMKAHGVEEAGLWRWGRSALWAWSGALAVGASSWLAGHSSGKLFLDWTEYSRMLFTAALLFLWGVLAAASVVNSRKFAHTLRPIDAARLAGLAVLLAVPFAVFWAAGPGVYPPVNPDTGGPTGGSLLGSTLGIVVLLLVLPVNHPRSGRPEREILMFSWFWLGAEMVVVLVLGHGNQSHHDWAQIAGLASLLPWAILMPLYYRLFIWPASARRWLRAWLVWWVLLVVSATILFLPGVLDRFKFTDALVGHSHLAMAGFLSSLEFFILTSLPEFNEGLLDERTAFWAWQLGVVAYIVAMGVAGWYEGGQPAFTMIPGSFRDVLYGVRFAGGCLMIGATATWLIRVMRGRLNNSGVTIETR